MSTVQYASNTGTDVGRVTFCVFFVAMRSSIAWRFHFSSSLKSSCTSSRGCSTRIQPELVSRLALEKRSWCGVSCRYTENELGKRITTWPSEFPGPASCRRVMPRGFAQFTPAGEIALPLLSSTRMRLLARYALLARTLGRMSFLRMVGGTVQVGLKVM